MLAGQLQHVQLYVKPPRLRGMLVVYAALVLCTCCVCCRPHYRAAATADVHSPGVPRDCAALEGLDDPDLTALAAAANRHSTAGGATGGTITADDVVGQSVGTDTPARDMDAALSRLQEVSGVAGGWQVVTAAEHFT